MRTSIAKLLRELITAVVTNRAELKSIERAMHRRFNRIGDMLMGLKEDFETLTARFDGLESATVAVADDIAALKAEIIEANERANIDLSPLVARAEAIEAGLRSAAGSQPGSGDT